MNFSECKERVGGLDARKPLGCFLSLLPAPFKLFSRPLETDDTKSTRRGNFFYFFLFPSLALFTRDYDS